MTLLYTAQNSLIGAFNSLPVILMSMLLIIGLGLGNFGMLWIFGGQVLLFPILGILHILTSFATTINYSDTLVIAHDSRQPRINIVPSMWLTQIIYFITFIITNAYNVYTTEPISADSSYDIKVNNRKTRAAAIMVCSAVVGVLLVFCRFAAKSEFTPNLIIRIFSLVVSLVLGAGWALLLNYIMKNSPNLGIQKMDIFGITQQMILFPNKSEVTLCQTD
jgi:magnesium-transporting ATPase (P-type)